VGNSSLLVSPLLLEELGTLCKPDPPDLLDRQSTMEPAEFVERHQASCAERLSFLYLLFLRDERNLVSVSVLWVWYLSGC
jgi:hypothetical protein